MRNAVILDADSLGPKDLDLRELFKPIENWALYPTSSPDQRLERCKNAEIIISNKVLLDADLIAACPNLKLILIAATGSNNVDLEAAARHGVRVCNVAGYGTASVAQHCWAMILALATQLQRYHLACQGGAWSQSPFFCLLDYPIIEMEGKTLGIIGYGTIGRAVANIATAFGMKVLIAARKGETATADRVDFAQVISQSDVISLHCPLNSATTHLIGADELQNMKPSCLLINVSRGGLIDEQALEQALVNGLIAGAGLDTLSQEPPPAQHPLLNLSEHNLILSPHSAWGSKEARQRLVDIMAANLKGYLDGKPQNVLA